MLIDLRFYLTPSLLSLVDIIKDIFSYVSRKYTPLPQILVLLRREYV